MLLLYICQLGVTFRVLLNEYQFVEWLVVDLDCSLCRTTDKLANLALVLGWQLDPAGTGEGVDIPELERLGPSALSCTRRGSVRV